MQRNHVETPYKVAQAYWDCSKFRTDIFSVRAAINQLMTLITEPRCTDNLLPPVIYSKLDEVW